MAFHLHTIYKQKLCMKSDMFLNYKRDHLLTLHLEGLDIFTVLLTEKHLVLLKQTRLFW